MQGLNTDRVMNIVFISSQNNAVMVDANKVIECD